MPSIDSFITPDREYLSAIGDDECLDEQGWERWLVERQAMFQSIYQLDPDQLKAHKNREQSISRDYQGREILELLQNAADAAKSKGVLGQVYIELNATGLIVANTGQPFTVGGVKSLQTSDLSPKRSKNSKFIGSKGLGFRSILNWTRHPIILSGHLRLAYNTDYVHQLISRLADKHKPISRALGDTATDINFPVPLLPFPMHLGVSANRDAVNDTKLLTRCDTLKGQGFDTVIGMPFDRDQGFPNALEQVEILRPEFLLFVDRLSKLVVTVNDLGENRDEGWKEIWSAKKQSKNTVTIIDQDGHSDKESQQIWRLYTKTGSIDKNLLQDKDDSTHYHLVVAFQKEGLAEPDNLYSFFPTSIPLPVHALCHASLELEQNRKHLQDGATNHFVLARLAEFLAEKIEEQGVVSKDPYLPRQLIAPEHLIQGYRVDIKAFETAFIAALKTKKILPTISGELMASDTAISFPEYLYSHDWLPTDLFPHVVIVTDIEEKRLCDFLGMAEIKGDEFVSILQGVGSLSIEQRAALVQGIIDEKLDAGFCYRGLLLDDEGNPLQHDDTVFLPGDNSSEMLVFPKWAKVKILHKPLCELLPDKPVRDRAQDLSDFGVLEYSLGALIARLVSAANIAAKKQDEYAVRADLLRSLYQLYRLHDDSKARPVFPIHLRATVLNQNSDWVSAEHAYFGAGYSVEGEIVSHLYASAPEKLIANIRDYCDLGIAEEKLYRFLAWLRVEDWPRQRQQAQEAVESGFKEYVLPRLDYPAIFGFNDIFMNCNEVPENCFFKHVESLDGIKQIMTADSDAILAWLAKDSRTASWSQPGVENGSLEVLPDRARKGRKYTGELPSYIHWKIKTSPWLVSTDGKLQAPIDCMTKGVTVSDIFPTPRPLSKKTLKAYQLSADFQRSTWLYAGVRSGVEELDSEEIYKLLIELPARSVESKLVSKLYKWLINSVDFELDKRGDYYKTYIDKGVIYATRGDKQGYYQVSKAYHVDVEGFPPELLKSLPIVHLPKKRGAEKIKRLFGIEVLDKKAVNEIVLDHSVAVCTELADQRFQKTKQYIEIYRRSRSDKVPGQPLFERLQLLVCDKIQTQITFNGATTDNFLPPWTYSIQDDQLYICCDPLNVGEPYHSLLAATVGEAIASVFGLTDGHSFSTLYQGDEGSRAKLLEKMIGDELDDDLNVELQRLIDDATNHSVSEPVVTMGPVPDPPPFVTPPSPVSAPQPISLPPEQNPPDWNIPDSIITEPLEHTPQIPGKPIGRRVVSSGHGSGGAGSDGKYAPTSDGKAGESLAILFEENEGRFPLKIGHITGSETIAADILSFRSVDDRDVFKKNENQSAGLIERVIEAKEKWTGGAVKLSANEVKTAAKWKDKYFIYRFTPIDVAAAEYELTMLCNPLTQLETVTSSIEIALDVASTAIKIRLIKNNENQ